MELRRTPRVAATGIFAPAAFLLVALTLFSSVVSAGQIWDGGGSDDNWTTGANWNATGGLMVQLPPPNNGTANIAMPAVTGLVQTPLVNVPYSINSLTFYDDNGDGRFVVLCAEELTIGAGGVTNNDQDGQIIIGPVKLSANQTWNAAAGPLQIAPVILNGFDLSFAGPFPTYLTNLIVGTGDLLLPASYTSTVAMRGGGNNTYAGRTDVQGGTLLLEKTGGGVAVPGRLQIGKGSPPYSTSATVRLTRDEQISHAAGNPVTVYTNGLLDLNGHTETVARLDVLRGNVTTGAGGRLVINEGLVVDNGGGGGGGIVTGNVTLGDVGVAVAYSGQLINSSDLVIGNAASGAMDIFAAGKVRNPNAFIANQSGSTGRVRVYNAGSTWTSTGTLTIGNLGEGTLDVTDGGKVESTASAYIGNQSGSMGAVTVSGGGSQWNSLGVAGNVSIGYAGTGSLTLLDGATAFSGEVDAVTAVGDLPGSHGSVTVNDADWTTNHLFVGREGYGSLSATNGAQVFAYQSLTVAESDEGSVQLDGARLSTWFDVMIGKFVGSDGTVTLENGGTWNHYTNDPGDWFAIGGKGTGTLNILSGSIVLLESQTVLTLGDQAEGVGTLNIDGAGSELFVNIQPVSIGRFGTGEVNITSGGALLGPDSQVVLGEYKGADGTVCIAGGDSRLQAPLVVVGNYGIGSLDISDAGQLDAMEVYIAYSPGSTNSNATVDGDMSRLSVTAGNGFLIVGGADRGTLAVTGGGLAEAIDVFIGDGFTGDGDVLVSGTGSRLHGHGGIAVGYNGTGKLTVSAGAVAEAPLIEINSQSSVHGDGTLLGDVISEGLVSPGQSTSALNIDGDYEQTVDGKLLIELASVFSFDQLFVSGTATLAGMLEVALLDGFATSGEHFVPILTAGAVSNEFDAELLPSLPDVTFDVIYNPSSVVLHIVAPDLPGDYNGNGVVDAADYVVWRKNPGAFGGDPAGYDTWRANFGATLGSGSAALPMSSAIPEPTRALLILSFAAMGVWRHRGGFLPTDVHVSETGGHSEDS
jgi:T5SS/PEP-CTERM-associated repeat protein/autotransporter-associated beta strand protein